MKTISIAMAVLAAGVFGIAGNSYAQKGDFGKSEYNASCAVCHGPLGKGDGPYVSLGYGITSDLTTLAQRNNGVFPVQRIYEFIDGRQMVRAHGAKDMPIWGSRYMPANPEGYFVGPDYYNPEAVVQIRILSLIEYIYRLQMK
jgi:mono/diheme cytochrome c family protein